MNNQEELPILPPQLSNALAFMGTLLWSRSSFAVLHAPAGYGKNLLVGHFIGRLDPRIARVRIADSELESRDFLRAILQQLGISIENEDRTDLRRLLERYLEHRSSVGRMTVLVVENAHRLRPPVLEELGQLAALDSDGSRMLKVLLVGEPAICRIVDSTRMQELLGRRGERFALPPPLPTGVASLRISMQGFEDREIVLLAPRIVLGRGEQADIQIDSSYVSRYHALILQEGPHHLLIDLGSTNGVLVDSRLVQRHLLHDGDLVQIGPARLDYRSQSQPAPLDSDSTLSMRAPALAEHETTVVSFGRA